jgi:hypothetical protein
MIVRALTCSAMLWHLPESMNETYMKTVHPAVAMTVLA